MTSILERLDGVVHYAIQSHPDRAVHRHVLQTILWLADVVHFKSYLVPVTWARHHCLIDGIPTAEGLDRALDRLIANGRIEQTQRLLTRSPGTYFRSTGMPDLRYLSSRSLLTLGDVTHALRSCTAGQARKAPLNSVWRTWERPDNIPLELAGDLSPVNARTVSDENWASIQAGTGPAPMQDVAGRRPALLGLTHLHADL